MSRPVRFGGSLPSSIARRYLAWSSSALGSMHISFAILAMYSGSTGMSGSSIPFRSFHHSSNSLKVTCRSSVIGSPILLTPLPSGVSLCSRFQSVSRSNSPPSASAMRCIRFLRDLLCMSLENSFFPIVPLRSESSRSNESFTMRRAWRRSVSSTLVSHLLNSGKLTSPSLSWSIAANAAVTSLSVIRTFSVWASRATSS